MPSAPAGSSRSATTVATITSHLSLNAMASTRRAPRGGVDRIGPAAAAHPSDRDRTAVGRRRVAVAEEVDVGHAVDLGVIGDAGFAIAEADFGTQVEMHLGAAGEAAHRYARPVPHWSIRNGHFVSLQTGARRYRSSPCGDDTPLLGDRTPPDARQRGEPERQ